MHTDRNIEKLIALQRAQTEDLLSMIDLFLQGNECDEKIKQAFQDRKNAFEFIKNFLLTNVDVPDFHDINENLDEIKNFKRDLLHHLVDCGRSREWKGAYSLGRKVHELIGLIEFLYVPMRQFQEFEKCN